jgi:hypothetical protein
VKFNQGDLTITPTERTGIVLEPPWVMPVHSLVQLDDGVTLWLLTEILKPLPTDWKPAKKQRRQRTTA